MTVGKRRIIVGSVLVMWLLFAWQGISGGARQLSSAHTAGQLGQTFVQLGYGIFAVLSIGTRFRARAFARFARAGWVTTLTLATGLAPVVWDDTGWGPGVVAGLSGLAIATLMLWALRTATRERTESTEPLC